MKSLGFAQNFFYDFKYMYSIEFQKYMILFLHSFAVVERVDWRSKVESGRMITIVSYLTVVFNFNDTVYICDICK